MKLVIQIPCYNEAKTLPTTLAELPRDVPGFDAVEVLVIDDGSADETSAVAREHGADHVVRLPQNAGLARAFSSGLDAALRLGADVIVNTDGDNQYLGPEIERLVEPIVAGRAEMVIGDRQTDQIPHFSGVKKRLQSLGSRVVRLVSGTRVPDATSGFRAFSRQAAAQLNVLSDYTYTLETIIQAGSKRLALESVPIKTNPRTRDSRLIKNNLDYVRRSGWTILRFFAIYNPLKAFSLIGGALLLAGLLLGVRYLYYMAVGEGAGHVQSVILTAMLLIIGFQVLVLGLVADLIGANRRLLEDVLARQREASAGQGLPGSAPSLAREAEVEPEPESAAAEPESKPRVRRRRRAKATPRAKTSAKPAAKAKATPKVKRRPARKAAAKTED